MERGNLLNGDWANYWWNAWFPEFDEKCAHGWTDTCALKYRPHHTTHHTKSCEDLSWNHCTSTHHRSETNGTADRAVRGIKEGTSAVLLQSGLFEKWLADGKTPCERKFGEPLERPMIPFGAVVEYTI